MAHLSLDVCVRKSVTTSSQECQEWIDRGVTQMYGFNHEDAIRCFHKALSFDENCAMGHLYIAYSFAPNYNNPIGLDVAMSYTETQTALNLCQHQRLSVTEWETALITAHIQRFTDDTKTITEAVHRKYIDNLRKVHQHFPSDVDIVTIFAEALMTLVSRRQLWTSFPNIKPAVPETEELVIVLESALKIDPTHPGLCHLYVHTMELSPNPERALSAANTLRSRVPGQGHLLHMPSHIELLQGNYGNAIESNRIAIEADNMYMMIAGVDNEFYKFNRMHNYHFATLAAMFDGQFSTALTLAQDAEKQLDNDAVTCGVCEVGPMFLEPFASIPWHVLVRFGRWEDIITRPMKEDKHLYPTVIAVSHYARGVAFAALKRLKEADNERRKFHEAIQDKSLEGKYLMTNQLINSENHTGILDVAEAVLDGEIEYHKGHFEIAYEHLRLAVKRDQSLINDEPWGWIMPARHALGALLLEQGHALEAEQVYRDDLLIYKNNQWALFGLYQALSQQNKTEEAKHVHVQFEVASARADVKIPASCFCANKACENQPQECCKTSYCT